MHGNAGYRVKNLRGTSGCPHYAGLSASAAGEAKCAVNGCPKPANRACHVIRANQNADSGRRFIVYMCPTHNAKYEILNIRENAKTYELPDCNCGGEDARSTSAGAAGVPSPEAALAGGFLVLVAAGVLSLGKAIFGGKKD